MASQYTYSRTIQTRDGAETFTAEKFASFDEAQKAVEKGIRDRLIQITENDKNLNRILPQEEPETGMRLGIDLGTISTEGEEFFEGSASTEGGE